VDDTTSLHAQPKYNTVVESQDNGIVLGRCMSVADAVTTAASAHDIGNIASTIELNSLSSSSLTEAALATHDAYLARDRALEELQKSVHVDAIHQAARDLGIDLPRECFRLEEWKLEQWIEAHSRSRG
jgi:hypothetical protein